MINKLSVLLCMLFSCISLNVSAQKTGVHKHLNFDAGWKFSLGNAADPAKDFNFGIGNILSKSGESSNTATGVKFNDAGWSPVTLPHDWAVSLPFKYVKNDDIDSHGYKPIGALFPENSIGWYRKAFEVAKADSGGRIALQFDGIYRDSKVWVNGYYIGGHFSGYNSVSFDITDFVHFDRPNIVVVRADATQSEGWFYEGAGIYRHAWLNIYHNVHIKTEGGLYVNATVNGSTSQINIETTVENKAINRSDATVYTYITDRNGKIVATGKELPLTLAINENKTIEQQLSLNNPRLWSLTDPYLYRAVSVVKLGGRVCDSVNVRFGIRTIKFDSDHGFFLNGKPLKVQGVSCHQDHAGLGSALPDHIQYYRIALLKEMGVNAYRTTHNPPTPELLDACDSLGMLVMDETRLLTSGKEYEQQFRDLLLRDRNHASIFIWSIGNEEYVTQRTDIGKRIAQNQILLQQQLDPSRTSAYAANVGNTYRGVNEVIPIRGFNYNLSAIDAYHKEHPGQPVIGTEVASTVTTRSIYIKDTVHAYVPDYDLTYPSWASTAESWWKITAAREWFMGGFAWTGFDYRGEPTPYRWPNINSHFGIMDMCGFPKNVYYYYQSWWTDKDVLHIAPHWNWKGKEGQPIKVWVNTNADNVELFLNGKSLGKKDMERNGHLVWDVTYEPGTLKAIAYKKGKKLVSEVETTDAAYKLVLSPSKTSMVANEGDASVINVTVVDKKGREVPDALNLLHFEIKGDAQIIGVGNGDPSSHEADKCLPGNWQRSLFGGKAQVIIKAGSKPGSVVLTTTAEGLKTAAIEIKQVAGI